MGNMDWLRRNWPDLLIGIALVAVIAGIIATLISGGSFFPIGQGNRTTTTPSGSQPAVSAPATTTSPATAPGATAPGATGTSGTAATAPGATAPGATGTEASATVTPPPAETGGSSISVLPPPGSSSSTAGTSGSGTTPASTPATTPQVASSASQVTSTPTATTAPASSGAAATASPTASTLPTAPYRVSVGAFGSIENANRQADAFRAAGYPVFLGTQGSLNLVLVGPYDTEAEARSVADRIRSDSSLNVTDPTVYLLEDAEADAAQTASTAPPTTSSAASPAPTAQPAATAQPAPTTQPAATPTASSTTAATAATATGRYLQVGAYGSRESSLPQRDRVEALGFVVSEREESGLIKLLIGPFDAGALAAAQARLEAAGVESFAR